jgi:hypothetical protein
MNICGCGEQEGHLPTRLLCWWLFQTIKARPVLLYQQDEGSETPFNVTVQNVFFEKPLEPSFKKSNRDGTLC